MFHLANETHIISGTFLILGQQTRSTDSMSETATVRMLDQFNFNNQLALSGDLLVLKSRKQANLYISRDSHEQCLKCAILLCRDCEQ